MFELKMFKKGSSYYGNLIIKTSAFDDCTYKASVPLSAIPDRAILLF